MRLNNLVAQLGTKGGLISEGIFSFWSHPKKLSNHYLQIFSHKLNKGWKVEVSDLAHL